MRGLRLLLALVALGMGGAAAARETPEHWVAVWAPSPMLAADSSALPATDASGVTLRQVMRVSLGGKRLRVRLTNAFGTSPMTVDAASIALPAGGSRVDTASLRRLTFGGAASVTIPAGADYWSDPVVLQVAAGGDVAVTLYLAKTPERQTGHPGSRATSYYASGAQADAAELSGVKPIAHWYWVGGIEADAPGASAVVVLGDSITDGYGIPPDSNTRWPDVLAKRLRRDPALRNMAVLNGGIGGNRLLLDGTGPNGLSRFEREVLGRPGVTHVIVLEGVNDLGTLTRDAPASADEHAALVARMIGAYRQIAARARAHGIKPIGATILPYAGSAYYHPDAANEADRQALNAWIRAPGNFDGVVDFDAAMRDPARPSFMLAAYDSGDGLHPSVAGYAAMADAVPLAVLGSKAKPRAKPAEPAPIIALTFDDMPAHSALPNDTTRVEVADRIIAALKAAHAPAFGFINGVLTEREPASAPVLKAWRDAGLALGNHGWSHANLERISDAQFAEEVAKNEPMLRSLMGNSDWQWFRYPFLDEASGDPVRRARIRKLLAERGYKVAPVTMDFSDWAYNDVYARCVAKGDQAAIATMEAAFLAGAEANIARYRAMAKALYGRDIPYVLLMHLGAFDARMMPRLLAVYRKHGFHFVSLAEATRDPYYRADVNPALTPDPQGLEGATVAKGLPVPAGYERPALDSFCL